MISVLEESKRINRICISDVQTLRGTEQPTSQSPRGGFAVEVFDLIPQPTEFSGDKNEGGSKKELRKAFKIMRYSSIILGIQPLVLNPETAKYEFKWKSFTCIYSILIICWFTILVSSSLIGLTRFIANYLIIGDLSSKNSSFTDANNASKKYTLDPESLKIKELMGILIGLGCIFNAWLQSITIFYHRRRIAMFINRWSDSLLEIGIDPMSGISVVSSTGSIFIFVVASLILIVCFIGYPKTLSEVIESLTTVMLLAPEDWVTKSPMTKQITRIVGGLILVHNLLIYKIVILVFGSTAKLLGNSFTHWRCKLEKAIEAQWKNPGTRNDSEKQIFCELNETHVLIVKMLRETETIYAPILQFYYATCIITTCTMLYFIASQNNVNMTLTIEEIIWQSIIFGQFLVVFFVVSVSACNVHEESEKCFDSIRKGLPFDSSDEDKYFFSEVARSITLSPLAISGNRFFIITKPFLLTIVGVVLSYFIIILQLQK